MRGWGIVSLLGASVGLVACGLVGPGRIEPAGNLSISCGVMPRSACEEQARAVAARHPGATEVVLQCTAASCDRKGGFGRAAVTLRDGSKVPDTFAYTGDPAPLPEPECLGVAPVQCQRIAGEFVDPVPLSKRIVRIVVRCTSASCTRDAGEADVTITLGDGSVLSDSWDWESAG